jgi:hypothetical protein
MSDAPGYTYGQVQAMKEAWASRLAEVEAERDALKAAKWDVKHTDTMNEIVQMGMARDEAEARADRLAREVDALRKACNQARLSLAGYISRQAGIDAIDRAGG